MNTGFQISVKYLLDSSRYFLGCRMYLYGPRANPLGVQVGIDLSLLLELHTFIFGADFRPQNKDQRR